MFAAHRTGEDDFVTESLKWKKEVKGENMPYIPKECKKRAENE